MQRNPVDIRLLLAVIALTVFGMIMVSSVSVYSSNKITSVLVRAGQLDQPNNYFYLLRNMAHVGIGFLTIFFLSRIPFRFFERHSKRIFSFIILLLFGVLFFGKTYNGAKGWIDIPLLPSLQPAEFLKIASILYLSYFLKRRQGDMGSLERGFLPYVVTMSFFMIPLALQPDFGTILICAPIAIILFYVGGGNIKYILFFLVFSLILGASVYAIGRHKWVEDRNTLSYITDRMDNFFTPNKEAITSQTINYQTKQGLIAIGSGGFWGLGFGKSIQKYGYLPEVEGDFIFSVISEEWGFIGVTLLLATFLFIMWRGVEIARRSQDAFAKYTAIGIVSWIFIQAYVNIGVNLNIVPLTGVTLPFVSYGGSSLFALMLGIAILLSISREAHAHLSDGVRRAS